MASSNIITLNVGGTIYTTSIETLTRYPDSKLGTMFRTTQPGNSGSQLDPSNRDEHGRFVIDRDGPMFRYVLNFLRESNLTLPEDFKELKLLRREAEFYQIEQLIEAVDMMKPTETRTKMASNIITLNVGGTIYKTSIETLTRYPDSKLGTMFRTTQPGNSGSQLDPYNKDEQGRFVIDRDGPMFCYVLNFLRESSLTLPEDFKELKLLRREAEFYQIEPLIEAVCKSAFIRVEYGGGNAWKLLADDKAILDDVYKGLKIVKDVEEIPPYECGGLHGFQPRSIPGCTDVPLDMPRLITMLIKRGFRLVLRGLGEDYRGSWIFQR